VQDFGSYGNSEKCEQFGSQFRKIPLTCGTTRIDDYIDTAWNIRPRCPQNFPDASADPVSLDRQAQLSRGSHTHSAVLKAIGAHKDNKGARVLSCAPLVYRLEFSGVLKLRKLLCLLSSAQPKRVCVPYHAELSRPTGRLASSCARGNHVPLRDVCCSVGTFSLAFS
jgi:hypothetical protein